MNTIKKYRFYLGIDPGVHTGFALWDREKRQFSQVKTLAIHQAMTQVQDIKNTSPSIMVRVEDARKRKWFGSKGREQLQGAGSIKRDAGIWEDFLKDLGVPFEMVAPKGGKTKLSVQTFQKITGYNQRTSEHARDAAMLVYSL